MFLRNSLYLKRYNTVLHDCCRLLNTQLERQPLTVNSLKQNPTEKKLIINDIESKLACFMKNHYDLERNEAPEITTSLVPKKFFMLKKPVGIKYSFAVDDNVAEKIGSYVNKYIAEDDLVLEINPGLGLMTHHLLQSKAKRIYLCQREELMPPLRNLVLSSQNRISCLLPQDLNEIVYKEPILPFISHLAKSKENGQKLIIVSVLHNIQFFSKLCNLIKNDSWHYYDNLEFYVILSPKIKKNLFSNKYQKYSTYAMFHTLMHSELLCELPRESFLPWPKTNEDSMFLYRITNNPLAFDIIKKEEYRDFHQFLKIVGRSKYNFIIPTLEHWAPGCGAELINQGITTYTKINEVPIERAAHLYHWFKSSPGYENYKMVISNEHKGLIQIEENEDEKLENELDPQHCMAIT